jgi:hypothetical protein
MLWRTTVLSRRGRQNNSKRGAIIGKDAIRQIHRMPYGFGPSER